MALITCPECTQRISDRAATCPNCGFPIGAKPEHKNPRTTSHESAGHDAHAPDSQGRSPAVARKDGNAMAVFALAMGVLVLVLVGLMAHRAVAHGVSYMSLVWCIPCTIGCWWCVAIIFGSIAVIKERGIVGSEIKAIIGSVVGFVLALLLLANQLRLIE